MSPRTPRTVGVPPVRRRLIGLLPALSGVLLPLAPGRPRLAVPRTRLTKPAANPTPDAGAAGVFDLPPAQEKAARGGSWSGEAA